MTQTLFTAMASGTKIRFQNEDAIFVGPLGDAGHSQNFVVQFVDGGLNYITSASGAEVVTSLSMTISAEEILANETADDRVVIADGVVVADESPITRVAENGTPIPVVFNDHQEPGEVADPSEQMALILAGKSKFTIQSKSTGKHFTFKIGIAKDRETGKRNESGPWFVSVLNGPDNYSNYQYLGSVFGGDQFAFQTTRGTKVSDDAPSMKAWSWYFTRLANGRPLNEIVFRHEGHCCRCGRLLTEPESIDSGLGPVCRGKVGRLAA